MIVLAGITFVCQEPLPDSVTGDYYVGLMSLDLTTIRPNYEAMIRSGHLKPTDANGANGTDLRAFSSFLVVSIVIFATSFSSHEIMSLLFFAGQTLYEEFHLGELF